MEDKIFMIEILRGRKLQWQGYIMKGKKRGNTGGEKTERKQKNAFIGLDNEFGLRQVEEEPKQVANGDAYL